MRTAPLTPGLAAGRAALAGLLFLTTSCGGVTPQTVPLVPPGLRGLTVVSWNMNAGRGDLARLLDDLTRGTGGTGGLKASSTVPTTGERQSFVLLLQEAGEEDLRAITENRGLFAYFGAVREGNAGSRGNAIVSTLPLLDPRRIPLPRERQPRIAVAADIEWAGKRLFVVSAHLENRVSWWRGGLFSENARGRQAVALIEALPTGAKGVVGGDMNTWLGIHEPAWRVFRQRFPDTPADAPGGPTFRDRLILDHLFFDLPPGWVMTTAVLPVRYGSDHHPVIATVHLSYISLP